MNEFRKMIILKKYCFPLYYFLYIVFGDINQCFCVTGVFLDAKSLRMPGRTSLLKKAVDENDIWSHPLSSKTKLATLSDSWFSGTSLQGDPWSDRGVGARASASASSEDWLMSSSVKEATASSSSTGLTWPTDLLWNTSSFFMEDGTKPQFQVGKFHRIYFRISLNLFWGYTEFIFGIY